MNKKKMGCFLKELRIKENFTQGGLCDLFTSEYGIYLTDKAISSWENGKTIPDIEKLDILSQIFKVSIDDILDGEIHQDVDYAEIYFLSDELWYMKYADDQTKNTYNLRQEQIIKINERFNELLEKRLLETFTLNEEREFSFLFNNFFRLTDYYKEYINSNVNDDYLKFKEAINICLNQSSNMELEEVKWELSKMLLPNEEIDFLFHDIMDEVPKKNSYIDKRFKSLEFWQKDLILNTIQNCDLILVHHDAYGSNHLKDYELRTGEEYNKEKKAKEILKYLINNGACINAQYINFIDRKKEKRRIIDKLEYLYNQCLKPIDMGVIKEGTTVYYKVENNFRNRFVIKYYYQLSYHLKDFSFDEIYQLFLDFDIFPESLYTELAKMHNITIDREMKYIIANLGVDLTILLEKWEELHNCEKEINEGLKEIPILINQLKEGHKTYEIVNDKVVGGTDWQSIRKYCYYWNRFVTKKELKNFRKLMETKQLLSEIDALSLKEIREKYFKMEVHENE
ncbi:MAG: helix-turn-helix transcriptional regulator [Acholeplasmatales bacterium]|jgi:transcriptional regulator with XRE-family HTH domain|nr:helix-turn-helix transcriptional regulator [Acholeplasmatales bacterium]